MQRADVGGMASLGIRNRHLLNQLPTTTVVPKPKRKYTRKTVRKTKKPAESRNESSSTKATAMASKRSAGTMKAPAAKRTKTLLSHSTDESDAYDRKMADDPPIVEKQFDSVFVAPSSFKGQVKSNATKLNKKLADDFKAERKLKDPSTTYYEGDSD